VPLECMGFKILPPYHHTLPPHPDHHPCSGNCTCTNPHYSHTGRELCLLEMAKVTMNGEDSRGTRGQEKEPRIPVESVWTPTTETYLAKGKNPLWLCDDDETAPLRFLAFRDGIS